MRLRLPAQRFSTATLAAVYPWMAGPRLADSGVYIGRDRAGSAWCFDPWTLYARGVLTNPNMLVAGQVGSGKSALVKTLLWRSLAAGRRAWVIDPKGEYHPLAAAAGVTPVRLGGDSPVRINPLDPGPGDADVEVVRRRHGRLVATIAATLLGRMLSPVETAAIDSATTTASVGTRPTLPGVVDALLDPADDAAAGVGVPVAALASASRDVGLALRRLVAGDLAGILDAPTSTTIDLNAPLVVVDLSALADSDAEPVVMACVHHWLSNALTANGAGSTRTFVVLDEAWRVLRHVAIARWLRASWKLARAHGVSNIAVIHRLTDLAAAGPTGSEQAQLAAGLLADSQTRIVYAQPADARDHARRLLDLSEVEADALPRLPRGRAIWHVGDDLRAAVDHHLTHTERRIVDTDQRMHP